MQSRDTHIVDEVVGTMNGKFQDLCSSYIMGAIKHQLILCSWPISCCNLVCNNHGI